MIDIHYDNFETELIGASMQAPVLLDIWAPWCGPCKQLGPMLEQLEVDYAGRFTLAKLNADEVPEIASQLSQMFGVRSIPFCVMFVQGQPVDGFVGAMPQAQIQEFLDKHVPLEGEGLPPADAGDLDTAPEEPVEQAPTDMSISSIGRAPRLRPPISAGPSITTAWLLPVSPTNAAFSTHLMRACMFSFPRVFLVPGQLC